MITFFIQAQKPEYYERMLTMGGKSFAEVIKVKDMIEDGIKSGRITSLSALQSISKALQTGALAPRPLAYQASPPQFYHQYNPSAPGPNRLSRNFTPSWKPCSVVFERLQASGLLYPVEGRIPNPLPRCFGPSKTCAYHLGVKGHCTDCCYALKHKVEDLIKMKQIIVKQPTSNVNSNPLPNHNDASMNMIGIYKGKDDPTLFIVPVESVENYSLVANTFLAITVRGVAPIEILGAPSQSLVYDTKERICFKT
ncbi:hypothetical protein RDI58_004022 [Solanum bulbocastanum]|uniref:Uncharacterized protein n=1 Tax=Solanum bulbocastanum TaxID=147425 RepID=A0AAN8U396_SOLBU